MKNLKITFVTPENDAETIFMSGTVADAKKIVIDKEYPFDIDVFISERVIDSCGDVINIKSLFAREHGNWAVIEEIEK